MVRKRLGYTNTQIIRDVSSRAMKDGEASAAELQDEATGDPHREDPKKGPKQSSAAADVSFGYPKRLKIVGK